MDIKLKEKNDPEDFISKVDDLGAEIQNRYDSCNENYKKVQNLSNSILGVLSATAKTINNTMQKYDINISSEKMIGTNSRVVDFLGDKLDKPNLIDRYGESLSDECIANASTSGVQLGSTLEQSAFNYGNVRNATSYINFQLGENLIKLNTMAPISNIIDFSNDTYWGEEIITENKFLAQTTKDNYEIKENGAFCEIKIKLESIRRVNNLKITPVCKFPLQLCYIKYTKTDNEHEEKRLFGNSDIPNYKAPYYLNNTGVSINFDTTICKNIFIGINQVHYEQCTVPIPAIQNLRDIKTIEDVYRVENSTNIISGYKYEYGLKNIDAAYNDYSSIGVYETKDINSISTINKIYIEDDTIVPKLNNEDNNVYTDNEYYISNISDPTFTDWKPIFPINRDKIECERLFNLGGVCNFRFTATDVFSIKQNGKEMSKLEYTLKKYDDNNIYGVSIVNFNPNLIYTVGYIPHKNSKYISYEDTAKSYTVNEEVIHCNESNSYLLKAYPHMPIGNNVEVEVLDTIKNKIYKQLEGKVTNTTGTDSFVFNKIKFQYYIDSNRMFFNQNMDSRYIVKIKYKTLASRYKLKVILRKNTNKNREITQRINKICVITENI